MTSTFHVKIKETKPVVQSAKNENIKVSYHV